MDGAILEEFVGVGEQIALTLHKAAGGLFIGGDVLPELELAEIPLVGFFQEFLGGAQPRLLHLLGNGNGGGSFGEGEPDRIRRRIHRQGCDQVVIGRPLFQLKGAVLQFAGGTLLAHVPAEQLGEADHPGLFQLPGNGSYTAALLHFHRDRLARSAAALDLTPEQQCHRSRCQHQNQHQGQYHPTQDVFFGGLGGMLARFRILHTMFVLPCRGPAGAKSRPGTPYFSIISRM